MPPAKSERFELRVEADLMNRIDQWRSAQADLPSRAEAIRRLTTIGLSTQTTRQSFMAMKFQIIVAALTNGPGVRLDDAYVFAWDRDVYPYFHEGTPWHKPFRNDFAVTNDLMHELLVYLDRKWRDGTVPLTFYELESTFGVGGRGSGWDRLALIGACRYAYLSGAFDQNFWHQLVAPAEHPTEASEITDPFERERGIHLM
ncbi:hypothetical protein HPT29_027630 (plasmid) [Microvirga terrae]|uniref:Uncharacterized protein n=1 Tax=Microvirga terrae TaxID=2740529 RepID=A0ABY5S482_9HYPH|nr:hypothetical protein [Microvirga terrae]UVF22792.1 hypothetical protein HPT29_027630 [Microvirga terrae]